MSSTPGSSEPQSETARPDAARAFPVLSAEQQKLVALARGARARAAAGEGAAVLDDMGRSYAAASVDLPGLRLSALQAAVAAAVSSGSRRLEEAVVLGASPDVGEQERRLLDELGISRVLAVSPDGQPMRGFDG